MLRLLVILLISLAAMVAEAAERWRSDQFGCELVIPEGENWLRESAVRMPAGEMIFAASHGPTKQLIAVVAIPRVLSKTIESPAVVNRAIEALSSLGYSVTGHNPITKDDQTYLEISGRRTASAAVTVVCLARAALHNNNLILAMTAAPGTETVLTDARFLRVIDTFRLDGAKEAESAPAPLALAPFYHLTYKACLAAAGGLLVLGVLVFAFGRRAA